MPRTHSMDKSLLEAALAGLEAQMARVEEQIGEVRNMLDGRSRRPASSTTRAAATVRKTARRPLSAAALERISAAQKKRWANYRKNERKTAPKKTGRK